VRHLGRPGLTDLELLVAQLGREISPGDVRMLEGPADGMDVPPRTCLDSSAGRTRRPDRREPPVAATRRQPNPVIPVRVRGSCR
jgi:hypothetical protein